MTLFDLSCSSLLPQIDNLCKNCMANWRCSCEPEVPQFGSESTADQAWLMDHGLRLPDPWKD